MKRLLASLLTLATLTAAAGAAVTVTPQDLTLPYHTAKDNHQVDPKNPKPYSPAKDSKQQQPDRTLKTQVLENKYVKVTVVPELGGVIARTLYKPTGDDYFYFEGKLKDWLPWWESGVKMSFPYYEHGLGTKQPAGFRTLTHPDGSATVALWMEFSRFNESYNRRRYGRFSDMTFSQHVTVRPDENAVAVTFRIVNNSPWKQGRRLWTDTLYPRNHTAQGTVQADSTPPASSNTEWIFPAAYASDHGGLGFAKYDPAHNKIASRTAGSYSVFSWDIPYGFAGLYYPDVNVNRLRLFDPAVAPGAKQWYIGDGRWNPEKPNHMYNFCELWGGSDNIFEGIENWIGPGESYQFTYHFTLIKGLKKVDFADENLAVNADFASDKPALSVVTLRPVKSLKATLDGKPLGDAAAAPETPAVFTLPAGVTSGKFTLEADGKLVFDKTLPLELPDRTTAHDAIKTSLKNTYNAEMRGNADEHANTYQTGLRNYPANSTDKGRVLLRDGQLDAAIACLTEAAKTDPAEGAYLLGIAHLEKGNTADAKAALTTAAEKYPAARYYLALLAIADNKPADAHTHLAALTKALPAHWHGRLLKAYLDATAPTNGEGTLEGLRKLAAEDPADPFVQLALRNAAGELRDAQTNAQAAAALRQLSKEPGAAPRLEAFANTLKGQYTPPPRMK